MTKPNLKPLIERLKQLAAEARKKRLKSKEYKTKMINLMINKEN